MKGLNSNFLKTFLVRHCVFPTTGYCKLCLTEKVLIVDSIGDNRVLNKTISEFVNKCKLQSHYVIKKK